MYVSAFLAVLTASALHRGVRAQNPPPPNPTTITAHPDGVCQQNLTGNANNVFNNTKIFPDYERVAAPTFPGAESKVGGGWDVWWDMPQPGSGCRNIIMIPYNQAQYTPGQPPGKEIVNAGTPGCYFTNIPAEKDVLMSVCCNGGCRNASLGSATLQSAVPATKRDTIPTVNESTTAVSARYENVSPPSSPSEVGTIKTGVGSIAGRARAMFRRFIYTAPFVPMSCQWNNGQPFAQAGPQIVASLGQSCSSSSTGPCTIAVTFQTTYSTTATSSTSQTLTNSEGFSVGVTTGENFIWKLQVSTQFNAQFSQAVEKSTGQDISNGNSTSITHTISTEPGNLAALSFTPVLNCSSGVWTCGAGAGVSDPFTICQPELSTINGAQIPNGEIDAIVYG